MRRRPTRVSGRPPRRGLPRAGSSLLLLLALLPPGAAGAQALALHVIPVELRDGARPEPGRVLRLAAHVADPARLAASLPPSVVRGVASDHVRIDLGEYPELAGLAPEKALAPSFLIDYDQAAVTALHAELEARHAGPPSAEEIVRFTGAAIPSKTLERGWDTASRVARDGTGDCTEHAVLLAALARSFGRPARVVLGVALVDPGDGLRAFGHAWTELHGPGGWRPWDATPLGEGAAPVRYLPLVSVTNEGPGYPLAMAVALQRAWVRRVEVLGDP